MLFAIMEILFHTNGNNLPKLYPIQFDLVEIMHTRIHSGIGDDERIKININARNPIFPLGVVKHCIRKQPFKSVDQIFVLFRSGKEQKV